MRSRAQANMEKYEQEDKLVQLFADLKGTFKQLEGVTDLKKQDSLLQSTGAKLQEAKLCALDHSSSAQQGVRMSLSTAIEPTSSQRPRYQAE